ncbi:MAG: hypothetical protein ACOYOB_02550 [Myxococcota bacterium]
MKSRIVEGLQRSIVVSLGSVKGRLPDDPHDQETAAENLAKACTDGIDEKHHYE